MSTQNPFRGSRGDLRVFAQRLIKDRMEGFKKDMRICLTPVPARHREGMTYAYFPALAACCGAIEYLAALSVGNRNRIRRGLDLAQIQEFAQRYMEQPDYAKEPLRVFWTLFRNRTAHYGITSGVLVDPDRRAEGRTFAWQVGVGRKAPAIRIVEKIGKADRHSPWTCHYTHVAVVNLKRLELDICVAAKRLTADIISGGQPLASFWVAMEELYPRGHPERDAVLLDPPPTGAHLSGVG